jgi:hypothetical protein
VQQAGCPTCAGGLLGGVIGLPPVGAPVGPPPIPPVPGDPAACAFGCATCSGCGVCYPGREPCDCCCECGEHGYLHGILCGVYKCICCPDPCYEGCWVPLANASFFCDPTRPATQMRIRGDFASHYDFPDKAEFFWPRADGHGKGPTPPTGVLGERALDYGEGFLYTEGAIGRFGMFVELSYRHFDPENFDGASGFGDMNVGTKSLLLDCELIQFAFQFRTFIPTGNFNHGLGTGHVSLEPSFLTSLKLTPTTYLQNQMAYWFPIGGDQVYQGPVFHYHFSLNQLLCHCGHDVQVIGTAELSGWEICGGAYTDPFTGLPFSAKDIGNILAAGPGLRVSICNKFDFGAAGYFALTGDHMAQDFLRAEVRFRF